MKALLMLFKIEFKLAVREFSGVLFGLIMPAGIMILLGIIFGEKPAYEGAGFTLVQQAFPAVATVGICATGLMGIPLSLAAYREKKILKKFRVTPAGPGVLLGAQFLNNLVFAILSGFLVLAVAVLFFGYRFKGNVMLFSAAWFLVLVSLYSVGMLVASISGNVKTANLLTTILYFPMLFLSGATIPFEIMPAGLQKASSFMPLTQGIILLKGISLNISGFNALKPVIILAAVAAVCITASIFTFRWE